jgi:hypothetical protein
VTTEHLPPVSGGEGPIWDRPDPPTGGPGGKIVMVAALLIVVAAAGLGIGWLVASLGGGGSANAGGQPTPSTSASTSRTPTPSTSATPKTGSEIEPGRTSDFGYFLLARTRNGVTHITFDRATLLTGKAANDYAKAHKMESPVPNDYLIVNENPKTRDLVLGPKVAVTGTTVMANSSQPVPVSLSTLLTAIKDHGPQMPVNVTYDKRGFVVAVAEHWFP